MRRSRSVMMMAMTALLAACEGSTLAPGGTVIGGGGGSGAPSPLLGSWRHSEFIQTANAVHESRTTWTFATGSQARKSVIAWNITAGLYDSVVTLAAWTDLGDTVVIDYLPPASGQARFDYHFEGTTLLLGGIGFARVPP